MNTTEDTNATRRGSGSNDLLGPASEARWYCMDREGVAMLCKDEADARAQVIENDDCWPGRAPYRAALLCDLEYLRDGGDLIPLAQPRNEQAKRTAELCLSAWATARMDALEAENAALKREAHTWSKAAETYAAQLEHHKPLAQAVRNVLEEGQLYAEDLALLRQALEQVERALGPNAVLTGARDE